MLVFYINRLPLSLSMLITTALFTPQLLCCELHRGLLMSSMYPRLRIEALVWQLVLNQQMADRCVHPTVRVSVLLCFYVFLLNIYLLFVYASCRARHTGVSLIWFQLSMTPHHPLWLWTTPIPVSTQTQVMPPRTTASSCTPLSTLQTAPGLPLSSVSRRFSVSKQCAL